MKSDLEWTVLWKKTQVVKAPKSVVLQLLSKLKFYTTRHDEMIILLKDGSTFTFPPDDCPGDIIDIREAVTYRHFYGLPIFINYGEGPNWAIVGASAKYPNYHITTHDFEKHLGLSDTVELSFLIEEFHLDVDSLLDWDPESEG